MALHADAETDVIAAFPATPAQQRFWYLQQVAPDSAADNIAVQWELRGKVHPDSVAAAFQTVTDRHEILRTRFAERDGELIQQVVDQHTFRMSIIDVRSLHATDRAARIARIARDMSCEPFDLDEPGLLRITFVQSETDCATVLIAAHHGVFDGFSIRVLGHEIGTCIAAFEAGETPDLPELPLQYGDYALWQQACEDSDARAISAQYWVGQLQDARYFELPADHAHQSIERRRGARINLPLGPDFHDQVADLARSHATSAFSVGAAVTAAALHRITGQSDISFGTTMAGRNDTDLEQLIGVCINPVVLRFGIDPQAALGDVIDAATPVVRDALAHGDYPFDHLVRALPRVRDTNRTPLVSVFFGLQNVFLQEQRYGQIDLVSIPSTTPEITHDLNISIIGRSSGWLMMVDYDADRFEPETVQALTHLIRDTFELAFKSDAVTLDQIPLTNTGTAVPDTTVNEQTKARIAAIWGDILGLDPATCDGDFFDLGGHSLLVLRMLSRIEAAFGTRLRISDLLEQPTLAGFAARLDSALAAPHEPEADDGLSVITLNAAPADRPLILSVNQPFLYHGLARRIGDAYRCANLHVTRADVVQAGDPEALDALIEAAAQRAVGLLNGQPLILIGQCVDGLFAYRLAQRLTEMGQAPDTLAMIDSWAPDSGKTLGPFKRRFNRLRGRARRWGLYAGQKLRGQINWQEFIAKSAAGKRMLVRMRRIAPETTGEQGEWAVNARLIEVLKAAEFAPYSGSVVLFRTASQTARAQSERFGWRDRLPADAAMIALPGWHEDALLGQGTDQIADVLEARLARVNPAPARPRSLIPPAG